MHTVSTCVQSMLHCQHSIQCLVRGITHKGTATPMAHIDPVFNLRFWRYMGEVLYNKGNQMIELFILMQLIQVLTPGSYLINFYEDQKEVGVRTSISHKLDIIRNFKLKMEEKHMESLYCLMNINTERK